MRAALLPVDDRNRVVGDVFAPCDEDGLHVVALHLSGRLKGNEGYRLDAADAGRQLGITVPDATEKAHGAVVVVEPGNDVYVARIAGRQRVANLSFANESSRLS